MCQVCGCTVFKEQGREPVVKRAKAIIKEMGVTADNAQRFEDAELICEMIGAKLIDSEDENLRGTVQWVMALHQEVVPTVERSRAYAGAARELFANIPANGSARDVINTWHQLEQLTSALGDDGISTIEEPAIREVLRTVRHIHDNRRERCREIAERYKLSV